MADTLTPVATLADLALNRTDRGEGIGANQANFSKALGLTELGASYMEVRPGDAQSPFHVHYQEDELIVLLEGEGTYRFGDATYPVKAGDVLSAPKGGTSYAHQLRNTGDRTLKYVCISTLPDFNIVELPEVGVVRVVERKEGGRRHEWPLKPRD